MNKTDVTHEMTADQFDRMVQSINAIDAELGFAVNLSREQSRKLHKLGDKSTAFVDKTMNYSTIHADYIPPCSDMAGFKNDYELTKKLRLLLEMIQPVVQKIKDTYYVVGAKTFAEAREYYGYVKAAASAGTPGSTAVSNDLRKRYLKTKPSEADVPPNPLAATPTVQE